MPAPPRHPPLLFLDTPPDFIVNRNSYFADYKESTGSTWSPRHQNIKVHCRTPYRLHAMSASTWSSHTTTTIVHGASSTSRKWPLGCTRSIASPPQTRLVLLILGTHHRCLIFVLCSPVNEGVLTWRRILGLCVTRVLKISDV
jgi:hypothetical protein